MSHLKSLKFTAVPDAVRVDPVLARRAKLIARLEEQKKLAKDPSYASTITQTIKSEDGSKQKVEIQKPLRPNWRTDATGAIVFLVRYGFKTIEFEKGKAGIAVPSKDKLVSVIDTLISAVQAGELDAVLAKQSIGKVTRKANAAA